MYRFLWRPRWVVGHVLVVLVVVLFVNLGFWQLRRLEERRDDNALVEARMDRPLAELEDVLDAGAAGPGEALWRRVRAAGSYDASRQVVVRNRSLDGRPGYHVLTPLVLDGGAAAVYVNRGWVPRLADSAEPDLRGAPAAGRVTVTGLLRPGETRGSFGPGDPAEGTLSELNRADLERLGRQSPWPLHPAVLVLDDQRPPATGDFPVALPPPELSERNHLSYAVQWFSFSAIVAVGWPLVIRRHARAPARDVRPPRVTRAAGA